MNFVEIFGAVAGLIFVILEIKQKRAMWVVGGVSAVVYTLVFLQSSLYAAMGLQLYYLGASFYGWFKWRAGDNAHQLAEARVIKMPAGKGLVSSLFAVSGFFIIWFMLSKSSDPMPATDAAIAALSMLATYWVANRFIENWILWIAANIAAVYMYFTLELYATTALYIIYAVAALAGYVHWRKFPRVLN